MAKARTFLYKDKKYTYEELSIMSGIGQSKLRHRIKVNNYVVTDRIMDPSPFKTTQYKGVGSGRTAKLFDLDDGKVTVNDVARQFDRSVSFFNKELLKGLSMQEVVDKLRLNNNDVQSLFFDVAMSAFPANLNKVCNNRPM